MRVCVFIYVCVSIFGMTQVKTLFKTLCSIFFVAFKRLAPRNILMLSRTSCDGAITSVMLINIDTEGFLLIVVLNWNYSCLCIYLLIVKKHEMQFFCKIIH